MWLGAEHETLYSCGWQQNMRQTFMWLIKQHEINIHALATGYETYSQVSGWRWQNNSRQTFMWLATGDETDMYSCGR